MWRCFQRTFLGSKPWLSSAREVWFEGVGEALGSGSEETKLVPPFPPAVTASVCPAPCSSSPRAAFPSLDQRGRPLLVELCCFHRLYVLVLCHPARSQSDDGHARLQRFVELAESRRTETLLTSGSFSVHSTLSSRGCPRVIAGNAEQQLSRGCACTFTNTQLTS